MPGDFSVSVIIIRVWGWFSFYVADYVG